MKDRKNEFLKDRMVLNQNFCPQKSTVVDIFKIGVEKPIFIPGSQWNLRFQQFLIGSVEFTREHKKWEFPLNTQPNSAIIRQSQFLANPHEKVYFDILENPRVQA